MIIQFSRIEVERILLAHANAMITDSKFTEITGADYQSLPRYFVLTEKVAEDAAQ